MTVRRVCSCGVKVPKGRRKFCSPACAAMGARAATYAKQAAVSGNRVFLPDHPLASSGWVLAHRLAAYDERGGVAVCDASGEPLNWSAAKVVVSGSTRLVLCSVHNQIRSVGDLVSGGAFPTVDIGPLLDELARVWAAPCPAVGGSLVHEATRKSGEDPTGPLPGSGSPGSQVEVA